MMEKNFKAKKVEKRIYKLWEKSGYLKAKPNDKKEPFSIIMPPPNANGPLHIGHAVFVSLQDILIRYQRMLGKEVLWLPGFDHAGFETQVVFEKELAKEGKTRFDFDKETFRKMLLKFCQKHKKIAKKQLKVLGASCDWSKEKFTLQKSLVEKVYDTFITLFKDGLIYRGERIVNWCTFHGTSLSDLEVVYENRKGKLYYIKYPLKDSGFIEVATTRPETMLGDTAIAVNPEDERYKNLINKIAILPILNRELRIIQDKRVDKEFGTGAVKITPAHDPLDFEVALDHNLEKIKVIGEDGKMLETAGKEFAGLTTLECREKILEILEKENLIDKIEDYNLKIGVCYKCKNPIEPILSKQWFIKMKPLAKEAIKVVKKKEIIFFPSYFKKIYFHWLNNIKDWNISRQIVWGIEMPIYECQNLKDKIEFPYFVSKKKPKNCPLCKKCNPKKIEDVFDTWFSSSQWPYITLGYPNSKDFKYFYPTSVMETGKDILFFWVARMIMMGFYITKKPPFKKVILHGMVRDKDKQKMSKSKGNVIDPLAVIKDFGADSLRFALIFSQDLGQDPVLSEEKIKSQRNFINKIWNASRFILTKEKLPQKISENDFKKIKLTKADKMILKELNRAIKFTTKYLDNFKFHLAAQYLRKSFWHIFCDLYIEKAKIQLKNKKLENNTKKILLFSLITYLKLLHPFLPFITEEIYQKLAIKNKKDFLMVENWPEPISF
ncbi:MAG: valine--tRNA ligase [Minisyncoccia bacterium]